MMGDDFDKAIGSISKWLILILMLSAGMFLDEAQMGARMLVGGWDGIRGVGEATKDVICTAEGCE
jgi:hypothetical protein